VLAERVGQGEVGGFQPLAKLTWLLLSSALESPWLAQGGPLLSFFMEVGLCDAYICL